jgi:hypothetical protein
VQPRLRSAVFVAMGDKLSFFYFCRIEPSFLLYNTFEQHLQISPKKKKRERKSFLRAFALGFYTKISTLFRYLQNVHKKNQKNY